MLERQVAVFLLVGSLTVGVDFCVYRGLMSLSEIAPAGAKIVGFLAGTLFAYFANKRFTFRAENSDGQSLPRFLLIYALTLSVNVLVNAGVLGLLQGLAFAVNIAFLLATGVSAALNFLGMKFFVFRSPALISRR